MTDISKQGLVSGSPQTPNAIVDRINAKLAILSTGVDIDTATSTNHLSVLNEIVTRLNSL